MKHEELFSETEFKVLKIIGRKHMTVKEVTRRFYSKKKRPLNGRNLIAGTIVRINRKSKYHKLPWFLNGAGSGRGGRTVWLDRWTHN